MEKRKYIIRGLLIGVLAAIPMLFAFQNCGQAPGTARIKSKNGEKLLIITGYYDHCIESIDNPCPDRTPEPEPDPSPQPDPSPNVNPSPSPGGGAVRCRKRCAERDPETRRCIEFEYRCTGEIE